MSFVFKKAEDFKVSLLISFSGPTGSGKTYSALRFASGLANGEPIIVLDTENGRSACYSKKFKFDHCDLKPPFTPEYFSSAIESADKEKYSVIIIDSMSHAWEGQGGILDIHEDIMGRMESRQKSYENKLKSRDSYSLPAWRTAKKKHSMILNAALQSNAHIIMCFRAKERLKGELGKNSKEGVVINGSEWLPITDSNAAYEFTMSFMMNNKYPGKYVVSKYQEQHKEIILSSKVIDEGMGKSLRDWVDSKPVREEDIAITEVKFEPPLKLIVIPLKTEEEFKEEVRKLYKCSVVSFNNNDETCTQQLRNQWYNLCYNCLIGIDGLKIKKETAEAMHAALALPKPLSIEKIKIDGKENVRIDYGSEYVVFLDELINEE